MIDRLRKEAVEFYLEATKDFDIHSELFWAFTFRGATVSSAETLIEPLQSLGFLDVEIVPLDDMPEDISLHDLNDLEMALWAREYTTRSEHAFAERVLECQSFADSYGIDLVDFSVDTE
ncbi:MAG: hypothetical protein KDC35_14925 [Acidobacteria bacterium]|nr:hypothetical protein [Acidobacteriota bacterium]